MGRIRWSALRPATGQRRKSRKGKAKGKTAARTETLTKSRTKAAGNPAACIFYSESGVENHITI
jgi:hypothetical protein